MTQQHLQFKYECDVILAKESVIQVQKLRVVELVHYFDLKFEVLALAGTATCTVLRRKLSSRLLFLNQVHFPEAATAEQSIIHGVKKGCF